MPSEASEIKRKFAQAQGFQFQECNEANIQQAALVEGETRGMLTVAKELSKQKLKIAKNLQGLQGVMWNHANAAAANEVRWRDTEAKGREKLSLSMMQLGIVENSHAGVVDRLSQADRLIQY
jgi:hypothetical protein